MKLNFQTKKKSGYKVRTIVGALLVPLYLGGCNPAGQGTSKPNMLETFDDKLAAMSRQLPGFGGVSYDAQGNLKVFMKGASYFESSSAPQIARDKFKAAMARVLGNVPFQQGLTAGATTEPNIIFVEGQYTAAELVAWRSKADYLGVEGMVYVDFDEGINRIVIGILSETARPKVESALAKNNIPAAAVNIVISPEFFDAVFEAAGPAPAKLTVREGTSLTDKVRPVPAGVIIENSNNVKCTLGFNIKEKDTGYPGFVTASSCAGDVRGGNQHLRFGQDSAIDGEFIGLERYDPAQWGCGLISTCRYSNAALVLYEQSTVNNFELLTDIAFGEIAQTVDSVNTGQGFYADSVMTGNKNFDANGTHTFPITRPESGYLQGGLVTKMGYQTAWTVSEVSQTCATWIRLNVTPGITLLCQDVAIKTPALTYPGGIVADWGDSGAPVYQVFVTLNAQGSYEIRSIGMAGILSGVSADKQRYFYSRMEHIRSELRLGDESVNPSGNY